MKLALVVPGGVDRSGEYHVIPALLALIKRLSAQHELHVYALHQESRPAHWSLGRARVHNIGFGYTRLRAIQALRQEHRVSQFHLVQSIWSGACGFIAVSAARILGIPGLVHVAGGELVSMQDIPYGGRTTWRGRVREAIVLRAATTVTAASSPMIGSLSTLGIAARRVPLGVDLQTWPLRRPIAHERGSPFQLIHVASLNHVKDQPTLLRALAELRKSGRNVRLDVVGEDTLSGQIQRLATELQLDDRVCFHGFLTQRRLRPLVERAQLMVMCSRHEAGPLAVLEAAISGVPTVGTAVGHVAEWAEEAALSVPVGDASGLAAAIDRFITDDALRLRIAEEAQRRAEREDADYTARSFESMYAKLTRSS